MEDYLSKKVDYLASSKEHYNTVYEVARQQFARRKRAYNALSIFSTEDLSQELWCSLLKRENNDQLLNIFIDKISDFKNYLVSLADIIATAGRRKSKQIDITPVSQFKETERISLENIYYSY